MKKEWFEAQGESTSWGPCCWQGWIVTIVYILLVILIPLLFETNILEAPDKLLLIFIAIFVLTVAFTIIAYLTSKKISKSSR